MKRIEEMKMGTKILLTVMLFAIVLVAFLTVRFRQAKEAAGERFAAYQAKAQSIETSFGTMSFIDEGSGETIISCHGICGGYDQAYDSVADKVDTYRVLAPSRFGYPGSDMPKNATVEMQADAFVELLDQLGIEKTYILGTSAGGPSAIAFALKYPERTKGLILYCSAYPSLKAPEKELTLAGPPAALCSDFAMWLMSPLFEPIMGMDSSTISAIMPMSERKEGIVFDGKVTNTVMVNHYEEYDLGKLEVPVLMAHAKDDKLSPFEGVEPWAAKIPDCTTVFFESGGHLMTGNGEAIDAALTEFVERTK